MADINENPNNESPDLTAEELVAKRAEITAYYTEHIPALQIQLEYEQLLRDIEKTRAERLQAQMFITKSMAADTPAGSSVPPPPPPPQNPTKVSADLNKVKTVPPKRTLKKKENAAN